jgi:hypothetical protein
MKFLLGWKRWDVGLINIDELRKDLGIMVHGIGMNMQRCGKCGKKMIEV